MKKNLLVFSLFFYLLAISQPTSLPTFWFKVSNDSIVSALSDGFSPHMIGNGSMFKSSFANGYPALMATNDSSVGYFSFSSTIFSNRNSFLLLIAYEPYKNISTSAISNIEEYGLWSLLRGDTTFLTSTHYGSRTGRFRYQAKQYPGVIVTSNLISFKSDSITNSSSSTLLLLSADTFSFRGKFTEFIVISDSISDRSRQAWQSYLAMKYGSTLFRSNYISSNGDIIWAYDDNKNFSFGVGAIGRDDVLGLHQNFSTIAGDSVKFSLSGVNGDIQSYQTPFHNGEYIFWGHSEEHIRVGSVIFPIHNSFYYLYDRVWKLRGRCRTPYPIDLEFRISENLIHENLKLFVSDNKDFLSWNTQVISPSDFNKNKVNFRNLVFPDTVLYFTFGYERDYFDNVSSDNNQNTLNSQNPIFQVFTDASYLPNPVLDNLYINYKLTRGANVWFSLHSSGGVPLYQTTSAIMPKGYHQATIPMSGFVTGAYLLYVHVDDMVLSQVIIKH